MKDTTAHTQDATRLIDSMVTAARAAHIPGVGAHGSGFLSDPKEVLEKMETARVGRTSVEAVTGESPYGYLQSKPAFPRALGPLADVNRVWRAIRLAFGGSSTDSLRLLQPASIAGSLYDDPAKLLPLLAGLWWIVLLSGIAALTMPATAAASVDAGAWRGSSRSSPWTCCTKPGSSSRPPWFSGNA